LRRIATGYSVKVTGRPDAQVQAQLHANDFAGFMAAHSQALALAVSLDIPLFMETPRSLQT